MAEKYADIQPFGKLLNEVLQKNNLQKGIDRIAVKEAWEEIMGSGVMSYTRSVDFKDGVLSVQLTSSVLREELNFGKEKIATMLNDRLNKTLIKTVKLR